MLLISFVVLVLAQMSKSSEDHFDTTHPGRFYYARYGGRPRATATRW